MSDTSNNKILRITLAPVGALPCANDFVYIDVTKIQAMTSKASTGEFIVYTDEQAFSCIYSQFDLVFNLWRNFVSPVPTTTTPSPTMVTSGTFNVSTGSFTSPYTIGPVRSTSTGAPLKQPTTTTPEA